MLFSALTLDWIKVKLNLLPIAMTRPPHKHMAFSNLVSKPMSYWLLFYSCRSFCFLFNSENNVLPMQCIYLNVLCLRLLSTILVLWRNSESYKFFIVMCFCTFVSHSPHLWLCRCLSHFLFIVVSQLWTTQALMLSFIVVGGTVVTTIYFSSRRDSPYIPQVTL